MLLLLSLFPAKCRRKWPFTDDAVVVEVEVVVFFLEWVDGTDVSAAAAAAAVAATSKSGCTLKFFTGQ